MTYKVHALEGTGFVEVFDGAKSVAGPFTPDEADAWIEARGNKQEAELPDETDDGFRPVGIL